VFCLVYVAGVLTDRTKIIQGSRNKEQVGTARTMSMVAALMTSQRKSSRLQLLIYRHKVKHLTVAHPQEPIPAVIGQEAGYTLDRSPVHHRAT